MATQAYNLTDKAAEAGFVSVTTPPTVLAYIRFDRSAIMRAAWKAFSNYHRFSGIRAGTPEGRRSFGKFLAIEWANARRAAKIAAGSVADLAQRLASAERRVAMAMHQDTFRRRDAEEASARAELSQLRDHAHRAGLRLAA